MSYHQAILDFRRARNQANKEQLMARLTGRSTSLLAYDQVQRMLKATETQPVGLRNIPLDAIVGSVGRYNDFTRSFLPLTDDSGQRWARIMTRATDMEGLPPIEVYQIGDVYFVRDGNHRVSVARQLGAREIEAYVTKINTRVPLTPDVQPDELILKAEYAEFLEKTNLDKLRPGADLSVTAPGQYSVLLEQIQVHRYFMDLEQKREIPYEEAVAHWYDEVYLPVVRVIREQDALRDFPDRTETDLYVWVSKHRAKLEETLGWPIEPEAATADLVQQYSPRSELRFARLTSRLLDALTPDELEAGPPPGKWRRDCLPLHRDDCLFADILVPVSDEEHSWSAVAQATEIACRESAHLLGLHVVPTAAAKQSGVVQRLQAEFARRCEVAGISGELAIEVGQVARQICERSRWADLIVVGLAHPPASGPLTKLGSGFRKIVLRCATPVLAVPGPFSALSRPLLAFDGSPKAREALFVAAYLAARSQAPLVIVSVLDSERASPAPLREAGEYAQARGVEATLVQKTGPAADAILETAQEHDSDLILMGGYGYSPVLEVVLGSAVDKVLRVSRQPVLICR